MTGGWSWTLLLAVMLAGGTAPVEAHVPVASSVPAARPGGDAVGLRAYGVHTELEAAYPARDSLHVARVGQIRLRFTTAVQVELSAITVLGPGGQVSATPVDTVPGREAREIGVRFPEALPSGSYTVEWRTAGPDSHVIRGSYGFMVDRPEQAPAAEGVAGGEPAAGAPRPDPEAESPRLSSQTGGEPARGRGLGGLTLDWVFFLTVTGMVGVVAFRAAVLSSLSRAEGLAPVAAILDRRLTGLAWVVAVGAVGVVPFRLAYQASLVAGPGGSWIGGVGTLLGLPWGSSWMLEVAAAALFLIGLLLGRRDDPGRLPWLLAGAAALLMTLVPALVGHSGGVGGLAVAADALHVLAAGAWAGGLACLVLAGIPAASRGRREDGSAPALPVIVGAFSRMALVAVGVLVVSGITNALQYVAPDQLLTTPYGRLLGVKLLTALGAFALGFYNWRVVRPQLDDTPRTRLIRIPTALELTLAACVLAVTAAVVVTATP